MKFTKINLKREYRLITEVILSEGIWVHVAGNDDWLFLSGDNYYLSRMVCRKMSGIMWDDAISSTDKFTYPLK